MKLLMALGLMSSFVIADSIVMDQEVVVKVKSNRSKSMNMAHKSAHRKLEAKMEDKEQLCLDKAGVLEVLSTEVKFGKSGPRHYVYTGKAKVLCNSQK